MGTNNVQWYRDMNNIFELKDRKKAEILNEAAQRYVFLIKVTGDTKGTGTQMVNYYGLLEITKVRYYYLL
jgi:hypothetical protein